MAIRQVTTKYGVLLGGPSGIPSTTVFRGVPFAKPPVGNLRWRPPQECEPWEGIREAFKWPDVCLQPTNMATGAMERENLEYPEPMSEDCLYLNIWTPAKSADEKLPVLLWIHGGAFFAGHSYGTNVDGDALAKRGVILVSAGYRLGVFGFFGHPELIKESPMNVTGNYGLLDQIAALRWVHENIDAFGGDSDKITIAGQSAGSSSVQALSASPLTRDCGLHGAVMMSGVGMPDAEFIEPGTMENQAEYGVKLLKELGLANIEEARKIPGKEFLERSWAANMKIAGHFGMSAKPVVDGYVLPAKPGDLAVCGEDADIHYMIGHTDEGMLDGPVSTMEGYQNWLKRKFGDESETVGKLFDIQNPAKLAELRPETICGSLKVASYAFGRAKSVQNRKPVFYYHFNHKLPGDNQGAYHGGELWYFFNKLHRNWRPFTGFDHQLADICTEYLCNFVKTGDPNGEGLPVWKPTGEEDCVMHLSNPVSCDTGISNEGMKYRIQRILK